MNLVSLIELLLLTVDVDTVENMLFNTHYIETNFTYIINGNVENTSMCKTPISKSSCYIYPL